LRNKTGVKSCPLYQNKKHPAHVEINGDLTMHSKQKIWFSAIIVVKCGSLTGFAQTAGIIKAVKSSLLKNKFPNEP
jgi:hypothetical protein